MSRCWSEFALRVPGPSTRREGVYRPRYSIGRERFTRTINVKTRREANEELQNILGNKSKHIAPTRMTFRQWADEWLDLLKRNPESGERKRGLVNPRTLKRAAMRSGPRRPTSRSPSPSAKCPGRWSR